ncbi:MAG: hypothetical protein JNL73_14360 [Anaerolineales bacterium]|nr:hypothetical protein [Anaerolineales bacterium]
MTDVTPECLVCERSSDLIPLLAFQFQGKDLWICPEHLPILIHQPARLADKLAGAEGFTPAEDHD